MHKNCSFFDGVTVSTQGSLWGKLTYLAELFLSILKIVQSVTIFILGIYPFGWNESVTNFCASGYALRKTGTRWIMCQINFQL